jgi:hypothetical protein
MLQQFWNKGIEGHWWHVKWVYYDFKFLHICNIVFHYANNVDFMSSVACVIIGTLLVILHKRIWANLSTCEREKEKFIETFQCVKVLQEFIGYKNGDFSPIFLQKCEFERFFLIKSFVQIKPPFWSSIGKVLPIRKMLIRHDIFSDIVEFFLIQSMRFIMNNLASLRNFQFFLLSI